MGDRICAKSIDGVSEPFESIRSCSMTEEKKGAFILELASTLFHNAWTSVVLLGWSINCQYFYYVVVEWLTWWEANDRDVIAESFYGYLCITNIVHTLCMHFLIRIKNSSGHCPSWFVLITPFQFRWVRIGTITLYRWRRFGFVGITSKQQPRPDHSC